MHLPWTICSNLKSSWVSGTHYQTVCESHQHHPIGSLCTWTTTAPNPVWDGNVLSGPICMLRLLSVLSTTSKIMILYIKFWLLVLEFSTLENENRQLQTKFAKFIVIMSFPWYEPVRIIGIDYLSSSVSIIFLLKIDVIVNKAKYYEMESCTKSRYLDSYVYI